jgi:hypothetical protein
VSRFDWAIAFLVLIVQSILHNLDRMGGLTCAWTWLYAALPPFHLAQPGGPGLAGADLRHVLSYGGGLVVATLLVLRFRPLGAGGRE